jgi:catalase
MARKTRGPIDPKRDNLAALTQDATDQRMTTDQGLRIRDDQNSLKAGERGPTLLEDFILREKITHFDHERIPERVVHARGAAAHGSFEVYESQAHLTKAGFLQDPAVKTPVFVRFSTVAGSRGSSDMARDVRGFAVKFYTQEGNYDLVGNNMPVFFIQDAMKFPDLVHAVKPEPHNEIPQAASAHDTFWDFVSLMPESLHMILWVMSDRALPRSYRMMEGFGVHSFRLVAADGSSRFVKFHWKPLLGMHSVSWNEAQQISGQDPDFHRRDLWEAIESGEFPEWELGIQIVEEEDEHRFDFDILDATKLIPEELVPVQRIGKLTLNRNPANYFAETEQVAFHTGHVVPGIDFSNDPLLQGRLFSYTDTQLLRLGGPNFHEIPINRPLTPVHNNQRDGLMRQTINSGRVSYSPNTLGGGCPIQSGADMSGYLSHPASTNGSKIRARGPKFFDHFSQARMFYNSLVDWEQEHVVDALRFELGKVEARPVVERVLGLLHEVDTGLCGRVAEGLGMPASKPAKRPINQSRPADAGEGEYESLPVNQDVDPSPQLSMANRPATGIRTRKIAILAADGVDEAALTDMAKALVAAGAIAKVVAPHGGMLAGDADGEITVDHSLLSTHSALFDAVYVPGGRASIKALKASDDALRFLQIAFQHCKSIAATDDGRELLAAAGISSHDSSTEEQEPGLVLGSKVEGDEFAADFINAIAQHRHWSRHSHSTRPG